MRLRTGDLVRVLSGRDAGKEGTITRVLPSVGKVVVEGINIVIKHKKARPNPQMSSAVQPKGGRMEIAAPIAASKVQLVDSSANGVTRIGIKTLADGSRVRYAKKSGGVIDNE
ncbi:MAG: 50S ribosomal protein L24 [Capsulimonadaceae bacterium]